MSQPPIPRQSAEDTFQGLLQRVTHQERGGNELGMMVPDIGELIAKEREEFTEAPALSGILPPVFRGSQEPPIIPTGQPPIHEDLPGPSFISKLDPNAFQGVTPDSPEFISLSAQRQWQAWSDAERERFFKAFEFWNGRVPPWMKASALLSTPKDRQVLSTLGIDSMKELPRNKPLWQRFIYMELPNRLGFIPDVLKEFYPFLSFDFIPEGATRNPFGILEVPSPDPDQRRRLESMKQLQAMIDANRPPRPTPPPAPSRVIEGV